MVSEKRTWGIIWNVFKRLFLLFAIFAFALFLQDPFYYFLIHTLHYKEPSFFFINLYFLGLGWTLSWTFWSGVVFGAFGKKIDYVFILIVFLLSILDFVYTENITPSIYLGLVGVAVLGNVLGYMLKVGRQNWFGR